MGIARAEMGFNRFVQNGRVCLVNYGPHVDKLVTVVDVLDGERVLVTSPTVARQIMGIKRLSLTDIKIAISRGARKKMAKRAAKTTMSDFERFQAMVAKKEVMAKAKD